MGKAGGRKKYAVWRLKARLCHANRISQVIKVVQCVVAVPQLPISPQPAYPMGLPFHLHSVSKMSPSGAAEMAYMFF